MNLTALAPLALLPYFSLAYLPLALHSGLP